MLNYQRVYFNQFTFPISPSNFTGLHQVAETTGHYPKATIPMCPQNPWHPAAGAFQEVAKQLKQQQLTENGWKQIYIYTNIDHKLYRSHWIMGFSFLIHSVSEWVFPSAIPYLANPSSHNGGIFKEAIIMQPLPDLGWVIQSRWGMHAAWSTTLQPQPSTKSALWFTIIQYTLQPKFIYLKPVYTSIISTQLVT